MDFKDKLSEYIGMINCSGKELAENSGLSTAVISRYRTGDREPTPGSDQIAKLAVGLSELARKTGRPDMSEGAIRASLEETLQALPVAYQGMSGNFRSLTTALNVNLTDMARSMNFDASYLSRIRTGQRRPSDPAAFAEGVGRFMVNRYRRESDREVIAALLGRPASDLEDHSNYCTAVSEWLYSGKAQDEGPVSDFLRSMDGFDIDEYVRSAHIDELWPAESADSADVFVQGEKEYYGLEQMKKGELDFFRAVVMSKSTDPVFMCSDMPTEDMTADAEFAEKRIQGLEAALKRGHHFDIVHSVDKPFNEMMQSLESWIPMYMTGQISPWYLSGTQNNVYCHLNYVSGSAALAGECIAGFHDRGKYRLSADAQEVAYFRYKADCLLCRAQPLMDIYRSENENAFEIFLREDAAQGGNRRSILSLPPLYTMPENMLAEILRRSAVKEADAVRIMRFAAGQRDRVDTILKKNGITDDISRLSEEEFSECPAELAASGAFCGIDVNYTYEEYLTHLRYTEEFSQTHPGYTAHIDRRRMYRNIQITMHENKWVMVSKSRSPTIHFVIRLPKLRAALENIVMPVIE